MHHTFSWRTTSSLSLLLLSTLAGCSSDGSDSSDIPPGENGAVTPTPGAAPEATGGMPSDPGVSPPTSGMGESIGPVQLDGAGGAGSPAAMPTPGEVLPSNCTPNGRARNPLVSHIFTADPNAVVYGDRVYLYVSHDVDGQDGYDMVDYRGFSSSDMVNWQDHGVLIHSDDVAWAENLYAPGACTKNGKYYLYMPNGGTSIGVAVADDPGGPFVDPLGTALITRAIPGVNDVDWLFDPACFVDEDGQGYLYFGGGPEGTGDNGRVIRLNDDMISIQDAQATTIPIPAFFEAAHMHKHAGTYYLQYSSDFSAGHGAALEYMTSNNPMTGFQFRGVILPNAGINNGNNNHGSVVELLGNSYLFYHARKLQQELGVNKVNNRSVAVQGITYAADGSINPITMSTEDTTVAQIKCLDGFAEVQAETLAAESGIEVEGLAGGTVRVAQIADGDWVGYSQVDFRSGATTLVARVAAAAGGGTIDVRIDGCDDFTSAPGTSIGTCTVVGTGGADTYADLSCALTQTSGPHDLCLSFSGNTSFTLDSWHLQ
jgi:arabinoxylan arabinofuranohydrolase